MWRLLEVGEKREAGDEIFNIGCRQGWFPASALTVGEIVESWHSPCRRRVADPVKSSTPDPGDGYRLLTEGETINFDDEYLHLGSRWVPCRVGTWQKWWSNTLVPHRRLVEPAVEPVRVGDRVEVVSGTWSKSCGVVIVTAFDASYVIVKLDNVFVGSKPLTIRVSPSEVSAQKCAPKSAQVDPEWRLLEIGEVIRDTDQHIHNNWETVSAAVGQKLHVSHCKIRRRVRIESPGWRYLDSGETVQAGDEAVRCDGCVSLDKTGIKPSWIVQDSGRFRRKTTPFAG